MKVGYARVSSTDQSLDIQLERLKDCGEIFKERRSANGRRDQLEACLQFVRRGDTLVITRIDRLARSISHLWRIVEHLERKEVKLLILEQNITTGGSMGNLMMNMLGAFAQFETEIRAERQAEGIAKAHANGVQFGAAKKLSSLQAITLCEQRLRGVKIKDLMKEYGISKATVYRCLTRMPHSQPLRRVNEGLDLSEHGCSEEDHQPLSQKIDE